MSKKKILNNQYIPKTNLQLKAEKELAYRELARRQLKYFIDFTFPKEKDKDGNVTKTYHFTDFHDSFIKVVQAFAIGKIKKLMVSVPPQHGKTTVATQRLTPFLIGKNPLRKIAVASYASTRAARFGTDIKNIIKTQEYQRLFPGVALPTQKDTNYKNTSEHVDVPVDKEKGTKGSMSFVGRGSGLTGETVDILIMDDLYKNKEEANSPVIRQNVIEWYDTVADTRLHNESQQLIVFTRWHDQDLIGHLKKNEKVIELTSWKQLENIDPEAWYSINFEALKLSPPTEIDPRKTGEPLYPERHSKKKLENTRTRITRYAPETWNALYMGDPKPIEGLLYGKGFKQYTELPALKERRAYIDVADQGKDFLCAIAYGVGIDNYLYLLDVVFSNEGAEKTQDRVLELLIRNKVQTADFESNSGGYGYAREVKRLCHAKMWAYTEIETFHQGENKEARLLTNAPEILRLFLMPEGWAAKFPEFADHVNGFRKLVKSNTNDDGPDALTGCYEKSGVDEFWTPDDDDGDLVSDWC